MIVIVNSPDGNLKDTEMQRPFIGETIWMNKELFIIYDIIHIGTEICIYIKDKPKK